MYSSQKLVLLGVARPGERRAEEQLLTQGMLLFISLKIITAKLTFICYSPIQIMCFRHRKQEANDKHVQSKCSVEATFKQCVDLQTRTSKLIYIKKKLSNKLLL